MSGKKNKIHSGVPRQQVAYVSWGQRYFRKNLHISGTESKLFFLQGGKPEHAQITGG